MFGRGLDDWLLFTGFLSSALGFWSRLCSFVSHMPRLELVSGVGSYGEVLAESLKNLLNDRSIAILAMNR